MLTLAQVKTAEPRERAYKMADAGGLYLFIAPIRTVSWQMSIPRSNSKSSSFLSDSGKRTYISTTSRITSDDELNRRNGLGGRALDLRLIGRCYEPVAQPATLV